MGTFDTDVDEIKVFQYILTNGRVNLADIVDHLYDGPRPQLNTVDQLPPEFINTLYAVEHDIEVLKKKNEIVEVDKGFYQVRN